MAKAGFARPWPPGPSAVPRALLKPLRRMTAVAVPALSRPLRLLPVRAHGRALVSALGPVLAGAIADGELDFLAGRRVEIEVSDLALSYCIGLEAGRLRGYGNIHSAEAKIAGNWSDLLLLASRREDADTLFFRRRLRMSGNTELGLHLKNFLDFFEPEARFAPLMRGFEGTRCGSFRREPTA